MTERIAPLLNQPAGGGHGEDRADRRAQQGDAELGVVQPQAILNGRNARHPAAEHGAKEEKEARRRPARLAQVTRVDCARSRMAIASVPEMPVRPRSIDDCHAADGGADGSIGAHAARRSRGDRCPRPTASAASMTIARPRTTAHSGFPSCFAPRSVPRGLWIASPWASLSTSAIGTGLNVPYYSSAVRRAWWASISSLEMLRQEKERGKSPPIRPSQSRFVQADAEALPFSDDFVRYRGHLACALHGSGPSRARCSSRSLAVRRTNHPARARPLAVPPPLAASQRVVSPSTNAPWGVI